MFKLSIKAIIAITGLGLILSLNSYSQGDARTVRVTDAYGNPIEGAEVIIGEGAFPIRTNEKGEFTMPDSAVTILVSAVGFESNLLEKSVSRGLERIELSKAPFHMGEKDQVNVPFGSFRKRQIPAAVSVLEPGEILKYDQTDLYGALKGRFPGLFGSSNLRGMGDPLFVIDGIPRQAMQINLQEVEQITLMKDLSTAMMYGSQASNGVLMITTKRGEPMRKSIRFTFENGINKPLVYPTYLKAADYMELYNEALYNDGLAAKYTTEEITNTRNGNDPLRYPDEMYYNSKYLNKLSSYQKAIGEVSGGNEIAQYYLNLAWRHNNSLLKIGEGADETNDQFNVRGNINYQITEMVKLSFDGAVVFNNSKGPRFTGEDFWGLSSTLHPDYYPVLIPSELITDPTLAGAAKLVDGQYVLGGTSEYLTNIYGELTRNGNRQDNDRLLEMNTGLDFDLKSITPGLTASAFISFDIASLFTADLLNTYAVYNPVFDGDSISFSKYNVDLKVDQQTITNSSFYRKSGIFGTLEYHRVFKGDHEVNVTALVYRDQYSIENVLQPTKHFHSGLRANYKFKNKFIAEFTGVYAGSVKLFETDPFAFSPGIGLGWILTEEDFLKDNPVLDYFKLRANLANVNSDESLSNYYTGRNLYNQGSSYYYNQGIYSNDYLELTNGNPKLSWEKVMNINAGFESMLLDYRLGLEGTFFYYKSYDLISPMINSLPVYFTGIPYQNFGSNQVQGIELGLNYRANIGDLEIVFGGNFLYSVPKVLEIDELDYPEGYRKKTGKATDAMFGFVAQGLFRDQADINNSPTQAFGSIQPGDIKYVDLNGDNVINDEDQMMIGNSGARVEYGLRLNIRFKSLELFALATGQTGQSLYFNGPYYWVFGDRKYSEMVLGRWTQATAAHATYPRLSSAANANNFRNSTYWLYENDWFELHTVQLTYSVSTHNFAGLDGIRFFIRGRNLAKVSKIKDKTDLNVGMAPKAMGFSVGLTMEF